MPKRIDIEKEIARLDPKADCQRIMFLTAYLDFNWETKRAFEMALLRTFAVPSIATLVDRTGEFTRNIQRRYDDTALVIQELVAHGYDSERGKAFLQRMNRIHAHHRIKNDDYLYALSTFVYTHIDWIDRFGWRKCYPNERKAVFYFWCAVGERMHIEDIPETPDALEAWRKRYEEEAFASSEAARRLADATFSLLLSPYLPKPLWGLVQPFLCALMDEPLLRALGYPLPSQTTRRLVDGGTRIRAAVLRVLPKNKYPKLDTLLQTKTHPDGYSVDDIGPEWLRAHLAQQTTAAREARAVE